MIQLSFKNLVKTPLLDICVLINEAFQEYFVPIQFNVALLSRKIESENIDLAHSVGVFEAEKLVGLILVGLHENRIYNACTGILKSHRGLGLVRQMYTYLFSHLPPYQHELEVMYANTRAIRAYESLGFKKTDLLHCFTLTGLVKKDFAVIAPLPKTLLEPCAAFFDVPPSWQNSIFSAQIDSSVQSFAIYKAQKPVAFVSLVKESGKLKHLAVKPDNRRQGLGSLLLSYAQSCCVTSTLSIGNISDSNYTALAFLHKLGAKITFQQWQMHK